MKKILLSALLSVVVVSQVMAQWRRRDIDETYRRSSVYSILISHPNEQFSEEIENCFLEIPIPDSYNDHDLSVKIVNHDEKLKPEKGKKDETPQGNPEITDFLERNLIASRLVAKWYNYDMASGEMDIELIGERGIYAASELDRAKAALSVRGTDVVLADAGEDLIQNTFVLVNEIRYLDMSEKARVGANIVRMGGELAGRITGNHGISMLGNLAGGMAETLKGFNVRIITSLYQLVWTEEEQGLLYSTAWQNRDAFEAARGKFKLKFIGSQVSSGSATSFMGIREDEPQKMIRKACQRALDENIANLQKNFQAFQIKSPINVKSLEAQVGMKEGINENSVFEVLERVIDKDGKVTYKKVGEVKPIKNLIWDNRYMAAEELAPGATLGATTFQKVSGGNFVPGCLIRQIK